jgi:hypothetical protein
VTKAEKYRASKLPLEGQSDGTPPKW